MQKLSNLETLSWVGFKPNFQFWPDLYEFVIINDKTGKILTLKRKYTHFPTKNQVIQLSMAGITLKG